LISHADVVIPVKRLSESKTRLSHSLSLKDRQKLVLVMMEDVVASLKQSNLVDRVVVLTPDRQVAVRAENLGAETMMDQTKGGINESIAKAADYEIKERSGSSLLILPVDVPLVKPTTIDSIIRRVNKSSHAFVVISPSIAKGTNALLRNPPDAIPTHYGVNSFDAHVAEARARKVQLEVYRSEDLEIDVDTPSDLYEIMRKGNSTRTSEFLKDVL
jgi:2-phospho-L-lactate guanylyltransferase